METITGIYYLKKREWNKVWRDIDMKNFSKALDHQGINFKLSDRKAILSKSMITEIETLQHEQQEKKSNLPNRYQFDFQFKEREMFKVVNQVVLSYVEQSGIIGGEDEEKITKFLGEFVPKLLAIEIKDEMDVDVEVAEGAMDVDQDPVEKRSSITLYGNNSYYCFFRLYQMLYSRLLRMREISDELSDVKPRGEVHNPVALELGLRKEISKKKLI
jgi:histone deacetylase complex regulatory component SIN3